MSIDIRAWLAQHVGCGADDLRFAGTDARRVNSPTVHFTLDGQRGYAVQITERGFLGRRRHWDLTAAWPAGSATTTVFERPDW